MAAKIQILIKRFSAATPDQEVNDFLDSPETILVGDGARTFEDGSIVVYYRKPKADEDALPAAPTKEEDKKIMISTLLEKRNEYSGSLLAAEFVLRKIKPLLEAAKIELEACDADLAGLKEVVLKDKKGKTTEEGSKRLTLSNKRKPLFAKHEEYRTKLESSETSILDAKGNLQLIDEMIADIKADKFDLSY